MQILQKLHQGKLSNDISLFPGTNTANRTKFYQVLWQELLTLSNRSRNYYKDKKSAELSTYIDSLFASPQEQGNADAMQVDSSPQQPQQPQQQQPQQKNLSVRSSSPSRFGSNGGDLTHTGQSLEQVRKRRKFSHRPDPFESAEKNSLFSMFWNSKLNQIPSEKKDVL